MLHIFHTSLQSWFPLPPARCFCNLNLCTKVANVLHTNKPSLQNPWKTYFFLCFLIKAAYWLIAVWLFFYEPHAEKLRPGIIELVPSRKIKWWACIASQTHHGDIKGVCNGIVVFIPEIAAGARLASQLLFHLISDLKSSVCVCVSEKYTCAQTVGLGLTVHVWVKDKGKGDRTVREIRRIYDRLQGWHGRASWSSRRCLKYFFLFSWRNVLKQQYASVFYLQYTHLFWKCGLVLYTVNTSLSI